MLASGLGRVSASRGDPRLIHYALEHSWRWLSRHPLHRSFWDPPIFHPYGDVAAFTDVLLGAGPLYWPWRALGIEPVTAFQLWEAAAWSSGFLCAYLLLRRSLGFGTAAAAVGAYLFAFGNFRLANHAHPQLLPQFAVLLGVAAVVGFFRTGQSPTRRRLWIAAFALAIALQMWTAYYPLFFFGLTTIFAAVAAPIWPETRHRLLGGLRRHGIALAVGGAAAFLLINPLVEAYGQRTLRQQPSGLPPDSRPGHVPAADTTTTPSPGLLALLPRGRRRYGLLAHPARLPDQERGAHPVAVRSRP